MEKRGAIGELCIKIVFFFLAVVSLSFLVYDLMSIIPLYKSLSFDEYQFNEAFVATRFYKIYLDIGIVEYVNGNIIFKVIVAFIKNISIIEIVFLFFTTVLLLIYFVFVKWKFVASYLKVSFVIILTHLLKFVVFGATLLIGFNDNIESLQKCFLIGSILYSLFFVFEVFLLGLWILKLILNLEDDLKYIRSLYEKDS